MSSQRWCQKVFCSFSKILRAFFFLLCVFIGEIYPLQYSFSWIALYRWTSIRLYVRWKNISHLLIRTAVIIYIHCRFSFTCWLTVVVLRGEMSWILREEWACGERDLLSLGFYCQCILCTKRLSIGILIKRENLEYNLSYSKLYKPIKLNYLITAKKIKQDKYDQNSQAQEWPFHCILNRQKTDIRGT